MAKASDFEGKKPEELFYFVDYSPEEAERIGYSNYSYWGSVIQNFLKQKVAVFCLILFLALTVFSFVALSIGKCILGFKSRSVIALLEHLLHQEITNQKANNNRYHGGDYDFNHETPFRSCCVLTRKAKGQHKCPGIPGQEHTPRKNDTITL